MNKLSTILTVSAVALGGLSAFAIPAKIGLTPYKQPDGTTINIRVVGNGDLHFTTTEDGTLLIQDKDGFYRYAQLGVDNRLSSTGINAVAGNYSKGLKLDANIISKMRTNKAATRAPQEGMGMYKTNYPTKGNPKVPVILVEFQDLKFSEGYDVKEYYNEMTNGENFTDQGTPGSVAKWFNDQSNGEFVPKFDIYGPVTLPKEVSYYGENQGLGQDQFAHYMVSDALKILDPDVDFSQYDEDGDGDIDFVYIFYAGMGENRGNGEDTVWPHAGYIKGDGDFVMVDGVWGNYYACSNELIKEGEREGISAFIHEYSHIMGLPDLYPSDPDIIARGNWDYTPGQYSILDYGVYNNDGRTPPNYTSYERNALKWGAPIEIEGAATIVADELSSGEFYLIKTPKVSEFYLLENRQQTGWDEALPYHGLLIWHIDYVRSAFENNSVNNNKDHQYVELIKANNEIYFGHPVENQTGYPFPGTANVTEFTANTTPAMLTWSGYDFDMPITNIREKEGYIIFDVKGGDPNWEDPFEGNEEPGTPDVDDPENPDNDDPQLPDVDEPENPDIDEPVIPDTSGIYGISADENGLFTVYGFDGVKKSTGTAEAVKNLPKGFYIINGKKVVVR